MTRLLRVALVMGACLALPRPAAAYCVATTCDRVATECAVDEHDCNMEGVPLHWQNGEVRIDVASGGSPLRGISAEQVLEATRGAFAAWQDAECEGGEPPSLQIETAELVSGATIGSDPDGESVIAFFDDEWPFKRAAVAKTSLGFFIESGRLDEADVALNSKDHAYSSGEDAGEGSDLQAVLTHELGHALGLDHSDVPGATMQPEAVGFASVALRSLERDDVDAICSLYPPGGSAPPGRSGGDSGGCSLSLHSPHHSGMALAWAAFGAVALRFRSGRRRSRDSR